MSSEVHNPRPGGVDEASRRAGRAVWWLWAEMVATAVFIVTALVYLGSMASLPASTSLDAAQTGASLFDSGLAQLVYGLATLGWGLILIVQTIFFLLWFYRAYASVRELAMAEPRYREAQAAWSWFVPVLNLFRPKQIANDIWRAAEPRAQMPDLGRDKGPVPPLLTWWWAGWLAMNVASVFAFPSTTTVGPERTGLIVTVAWSLFLIVEALLAVAVVKTLSRRQEAMASLPPSPR